MARMDCARAWRTTLAGDARGSRLGGDAQDAGAHWTGWPEGARAVDHPSPPSRSAHSSEMWHVETGFLRQSHSVHTSPGPQAPGMPSPQSCSQAPWIQADPAEHGLLCSSQGRAHHMLTTCGDRRQDKSRRHSSPFGQGCFSQSCPRIVAHAAKSPSSRIHRRSGGQPLRRQEGRQVETPFHSWQTKPSGQGEAALGVQGRLQKPAAQISPGLHPSSSLRGNRSQCSPSFRVPWTRQRLIDGVPV
jgi:hypothetical protein